MRAVFSKTNDMVSVWRHSQIDFTYWKGISVGWLVGDKLIRYNEICLSSAVGMVLRYRPTSLRPLPEERECHYTPRMSCQVHHPNHHHHHQHANDAHRAASVSTS